MADVLVVLDVLGAPGQTEGVVLTVVDCTSRSIVAEHELGSGDVADIVRAADAHLSKYTGRVKIVCDGPRFYRSELPTIKAAVRAAPHWQKYYDFEREVERSFNAKCKGLLAVMLTVGIEPEHHDPGLEKNRIMAQIAVKMLEKGNEFRRPMQAAPKKDDKEKADKEKADRKKDRKRKRDEAEAAPVEEEAEEEPAEPAPLPSMPLLREILFLAPSARGSADAMREFAQGVRAKATKKVTTFQPSQDQGTTTAWLSVVAGYCIEATPESPAVLSVPSLTDAIEAVAALGDLSTDLLLFAGELQAPHPKVSPAVLVTHHAKLAEALSAVPGFAAASAVVVADTVDDASEPLGTVKDAVKGKVVVLTACTGSGVQADVPSPPEGSTGESGIEGALGDSKGPVDQLVLTHAFGATSSIAKVAESLKALSDAKASTRATTMLLCYYLLATTHSQEEAPAGVCPQLSSFYLLLARLFLGVEQLLAEVKPTGGKGLLGEMATAVLELPLLPCKSAEQRAATLLCGKVCGDEVMRTAILSCVACHLTDAHTDGLADLWSVRLITGAAQRSINTHATKHGKKLGRFLAYVEAALAHRLDGQQLGVSLEILADEMSWVLFKPRMGPLGTFLTRCKHSFAADKQEGVVCVSVLSGVVKETTVQAIPLCGHKAQKTLDMERQAIEELLTILPRGTKPALFSSIGVSICSWTRFNTRYGRLLGPTLLSFMMRHPEAFTINAKTVRRADPKTSPEYETGLLKHGRRDAVEGDDAVRNQKTRRRGSRAERIHEVISQKYQKKQMRKNNLRSAKVQKIPGFGQKKGKYRGKGTVPHWMK